MARPGVTKFLDSLDSDLRRLFDLSPLLLVVLDNSGNVVRVNPAFERSLRRAEAEVLRRNILVYVYGKDIDVFLHAFVNPLPSAQFGLLCAEHGIFPVRLVAWDFIHEDNEQRGYILMQPAIVHETIADWKRIGNWSG
jgi:hypothetical protein